MADIKSIKPTSPAPQDLIAETQIACLAAAVIANHWSRPQGEALNRIIGEIREQVMNHYRAVGIAIWE